MRGTSEAYYSPGGEATRMIMAMMVDEIDEADGFRNCDGMHEHEDRKKNDEGTHLTMFRPSGPY